jgi:hypothetical protein
VICPPGQRLVFPGTRSERCVPAVSSAPAAAAAELGKVGVRPCTTWDRLVMLWGVERDCMTLPPLQLAGETGGPGPGRRLLGAVALGAGALLVGWAAGLFEEGP